MANTSASKPDNAGSIPATPAKNKCTHAFTAYTKVNTEFTRETWCGTCDTLLKKWVRKNGKLQEEKATAI